MINSIWINPKSLPLFWSVFLISAFVRIVYHLIGVEDFWGDSYHNVYISWLTVQNDWVYSDYSGREVVWLPFYRYLSGFFMFLFDSYSLEVGHFLNSALASICCGLTAVLVRDQSSKKTGFYAGITLGLLPWYLAYSHLNMPEMLASIILILMLYAWQLEKPVWLVVIAFFGVLTRNEVTLVMMVFGFILLILKDWKSASTLAFGAIMSLCLWGLWCYQITGEFFWWIKERSILSIWTNTFQKSQGNPTGVWYFPLISILVAFPFVLFFLFGAKSFYRYLTQSVKQHNHFELTVIILLLVHWIFIFSLQFGVIGYPDPKYYIVTLPLAVIVLFIWSHSSVGFSKKLLNWVLGFAFIFMLGHIPAFYYMHYTGLNSYRTADYIKENLPDQGNIWMDFTNTWYRSDISPERIYSSMQLVPKEERLNDDFMEKVEKKILEKEIKYIMAAPASFTYVLDVFPQMKSDEIFIWRGLHFKQLYRYDPNLVNDLNWLEKLAIGKNWSSFWLVSSEASP